jgi:hypothetical protein
MAWQTPKTNWASADVPAPSDFNRIEGNAAELKSAIDTHKFAPVLDHPDGSVTDAKIGTRTISDTTAPSGNTGLIATLLSWLAYMIKAITGKSNWRTAPATTLEAAAAHIARTDNPHNVTKSQVGLGSVDNYPTASQAEAEAGTAANRFMTPQRTKQYVDTRLLNDLKFRLNNGSLEFNDGTGWKSVGFDPRSMTHHEIAHYVLGQTVPADGYIDVWNVSAKGVLAEVQIVVISTTASTRSLGVSLVIDGAEKQFFAPSSPEIAAAQLVAMAGSNNFGNDASDARIFKLNHPIPFNSSVRIRIRNVHANQAVTNVFVGVIGGYYT